MSGHVERTASARLAVSWGHYSSEVLAASIVAAIVVRLFPPQGALMFSVPLALAAVVITSWLLMRKHDRSLCETCAHALPLNAAEKAKGYQYRFWMAHTLTERRFLLPYLAVLIGSNFFTGTWAWAVIQSSMIYLLMSHVAHRRFQPWCPWCSNGGGGSEHEDVTPPPLPDNDRQLV